MYCRTGPDHTPEDRFRFDYIKEYGPIWEARLRERWLDPASTKKQLIKEFGINQDSLDRRAAHLGLPFPRKGAKRIPAHIQAILRKLDTKETFGTKQERHRNSWLSVQKAHPELNIRGLSLLEHRAYTWLLKHDREWLKAHCPQHPPKKSESPRVFWEYWQKRDSELAEKVQPAAQRWTLRIKSFTTQFIETRNTPASYCSVFTEKSFTALPSACGQ